MDKSTQLSKMIGNAMGKALGDDSVTDDKIKRKTDGASAFTKNHNRKHKQWKNRNDHRARMVNLKGRA